MIRSIKKTTNLLINNTYKSQKESKVHILMNVKLQNKRRIYNIKHAKYKK